MNANRLILILAALLSFVALETAAPLEIDFAQSRIAVSVDATAHSFTGTLERCEVQIECDPPSSLPTKADARFNFADLKTANTSRDEAMLKWLEYTNSPTASYHLTGWKQNGTTNLALGTLTLHGIAREIQMPVVVKHDGDAWDISGEAEFDHRDFKLERIRKALILTVNPHLKVTFHLTGKLSVGK